MTDHAIAEGKLPLGVGKITSKWLGLAVALGAVALIGFAAWVSQLIYGLEVTGMRDIGTMRGAPWGLYIAFDVYFVGVSFAGISTAALIRILDVKKLKPIARMAELMTISSLVLAGIAIIADLGQPVRGVTNLFRYARPQSPFFGTFTLVIAGYLFASVVFFFLELRRDAAACAEVPSRLQKIHSWVATGYKGTEAEIERHSRASFWLAIAILPLLVVAHSTLGFVFGLQVGRPGWFSALQAPAFVVLAAVSGIGLILILAAAIRKSLNDEGESRIGIDAFAWLGKLLLTLIVVYIYFMVVELLTGLYASGGHEQKVVKSVVSGTYAPIYWTSVAALVAAGIVLLRQVVTKTWSIGWLVAAGVLVNVAAVGKRYIIVVPSQTRGPLLPYEPGIYTPSLVEYAIVAGLFGLGALLIVLFAKAFPIMEVDDVGEGPAEDSIGKPAGENDVSPAVDREEVQDA